MISWYWFLNQVFEFFFFWNMTRKIAPSCPPCYKFFDSNSPSTRSLLADECFPLECQLRHNWLFRIPDEVATWFCSETRPLQTWAEKCWSKQRCLGQMPRQALSKNRGRFRDLWIDWWFASASAVVLFRKKNESTKLSMTMLILMTRMIYQRQNVNWCRFVCSTKGKVSKAM